MDQALSRRKTNRPTYTAAALSASPAVPSAHPKSRRSGSATATAAACKHKQVISANFFFLLVLMAIGGIYSLLIFAFYEREAAAPANTRRREDKRKDPNQMDNDRRMAQKNLVGTDEKVPENNQYPYWRELAIRLAKLPAEEALKQLIDQDPFETRAFEEALLEKETSLGRLLKHSEIEELFPCPSSRITLPDQRNLQKARDFRDKEPGTFLFFQHLRKAGGTHFCSLAKANERKVHVAAYFCMPDMSWSGGLKAGYLHSWPNEEIVRRMAEEKQRVAGNEWDWFDVDHHFDLPAVTATSFRKPLDRALSQFRFECIEDRGCKIKDVHEFWDKRPDLYNVYTQTFADTPKTFGTLKKAYEDEVSDASTKRAEMISRALDTVARFNLVLAMEFLAYAGPQVDRILGWHETSPLTKRVRPHIAQFARNDGQEQNSLGAAGITKASWDPEKYLDAEQYQKMSKHLALDMILTDAARRMFLERLVCMDLDH